MSSDVSPNLPALSALFREAGSGPTLDVFGVTHRYKALASDTGQQFSVWESVVPPGRGAPAHTHSREDEAFYVLSGEVLFDIDDESSPLRLGPGSFLFAPRHRRHGYRNVGTDSARLLVFAMPGDGLDRMFAAFDELRNQSGQIPAAETITTIARQYGVVIHSSAG